MPDDILDSDFRKEEDYSKKEEPQWWIPLLQEVETIHLQQQVGVEQEHLPMYKESDLFFKILGVSIVWHLMGLLLLYLLGDTIWLTSLILGVWALIIIVVWGQNNYSQRRKSSSVVKIQQQQLILTNQRILLEDGSQFFLEDILIGKKGQDDQTQVIIELKRNTSLELMMPNIQAAEQLTKEIEQLRFR